MRKCKRKIITAMTAVVVTIILIAVYFSRCDTTTNKTYDFLNFEAKIQQYGENLVDNYYVVDERYKNLEFSTKGYTIEINQDGNCLGGINLEVLPEFFGEVKKEEPKLVKVGKVTKKMETSFASAKEIVMQYVEQSSIIKEEDKEDVKDAILNMNLIVGKFSDEYAEYGMITYEDNIYINDDVKSKVDEYIFVHELIHVINSVTATGSKYESTYLNNGGLSEGITDMIAITMINWCELESEMIQKSKYIKYFDTAYVLMNNDKFDLLEAYYYPDNYDKLIEITDEEFVKCIFASVFVLDSQGYANSNYLACNYYLQK